MGSSVSAAKKRERVERAGSQSRRNLRHEGNGKRLEPLVERLQRAFTANGVPEEHGEKIEHFVVPKAPPRKTHTLSDVGQNVVFAKMCRHQHGLSEPRRRCGNGLGRGLDTHRSIGDTGHMCLASENVFASFFSRRHIFIYLCSLRGRSSLRIAWEKSPAFWPSCSSPSFTRTSQYKMVRRETPHALARVVSLG